MQFFPIITPLITTQHILKRKYLLCLCENLLCVYSAVKFIFHLLQIFPILRSPSNIISALEGFLGSFFFKSLTDFTQLYELIKQKWSVQSGVISMKNHLWIYLLSVSLHLIPLKTPSLPYGRLNCD